MYLIIKKGRLYRPAEKDTINIEILNAFGRRWETLTHSEEDSYLASVWDREARYMKLKKNEFEDGMYRLMTKGKFKLMFPVEKW